MLSKVGFECRSNRDMFQGNLNKNFKKYVIIFKMLDLDFLLRYMPCWSNYKSSKVLVLMLIVNYSFHHCINITRNHRPMIFPDSSFS